MHFSNIVAVTALGLSNAVLANYPDAPIVTNNPYGRKATARLPQVGVTQSPGYTSGMRGDILVETNANGLGVQYTIDFSNFPIQNLADNDYFLYHIHKNPVPSDGNCQQTLTHLDPQNVGDDTTCPRGNAKQCQVGDLSGKQGTISVAGLRSTQNHFTAKFPDSYTSMARYNEVNYGSSPIGRSIVIHFSNKTRIACANILEVNNGTTSSSSGLPTGSPVTVSAAQRTLSVGASLGGAVVLLASLVFAL